MNLSEMLVVIITGLMIIAFVCVIWECCTSKDDTANVAGFTTIGVLFFLFILSFFVVASIGAYGYELCYIKIK